MSQTVVCEALLNVWRPRSAAEDLPGLGQVKLPRAGGGRPSWRPRALRLRALPIGPRRVCQEGKQWALLIHQTAGLLACCLEVLLGRTIGKLANPHGALGIELCSHGLHSKIEAAAEPETCNRNNVITNCESAHQRAHPFEQHDSMTAHPVALRAAFTLTPCSRTFSTIAVSSNRRQSPQRNQHEQGSAYT